MFASPLPFPRLPRYCRAVFLLLAGLAWLPVLTAQRPGYWNFPTQADDYLPSALLDLRDLNEDVAGQSGFVSRSGDDWVLGDGSKVRFWSVGLEPAGDTLESVREQMRFLAKRGINLVRWHNNLFSNNAERLADVNTSSLNNLHRVVAAARQEGIYVRVSFFFQLNLRVPARWEIDGYTQAWIDANDDSPTSEPDWSVKAPYGLWFFDEKMQAAHLTWLETLLKTPNPYDGGRTLAEEPAVAMIETLNEDNLFWWSWNPQRFPQVQRQKIYRAFGDFLRAKYGSIAAAQSAWGTLSGSNWPEDDPANGRLQVGDANSMTAGGPSGVGNQRRIADQIAFLGQVQHDFYARMHQAMRDFGFRGVTAASNWKTAEDEVLKDLEYYTYTATDSIDDHNYFSPGVATKAVSGLVQGGDKYYKIPGVSSPRDLPTVFKQVEDRPCFVSESTWTRHHPYRPEAALLVAAGAALIDLDGFSWFMTSSGGWQNVDNSWTVGTPDLLGLFPGPALLYRLGYVAEAPVVVREGRDLASIEQRRSSLLLASVGYDPTRDVEAQYPYDPTTNQGAIDPAAILVGKAEVAFDGEEDYVCPALSEQIDAATGAITSLTGELLYQPGQMPGRISGDTVAAGTGYFRVDSPRAQGAAGFLNALGANVVCHDLQIRLRNDFGSVLVVPLDDRPINQSTRLLVQACARVNPTGWASQPTTVRLFNANWQGEEVTNRGTLPWEMEEIKAQVRLTGQGRSGRVKAVWSLNPNGYSQGANTSGRAFGDDYLIDLDKNALYTVIELDPVADPAPVLLTPVLPNGDKGQPYLARLEAAGGDAPLVFSAAALPAGLTLAGDGTLSGQPGRGGDYRLTITATDADGDAVSGEVRLFVRPVDDPGCDSLFAAPGTADLGGGWKWNGLSYFYDGFYPFIWLYESGSWIYVFGCAGEVTEEGGYYLYDFGRAQFGFTRASYYPWYFALGGAGDGQAFSLRP